jgi:hypothetical protein
LHAWHDPRKREHQPWVFVTGLLTIASDARFDHDTTVSSLPMRDSPDIIARIYERDGISGLGRLDGEFTIVIYDPVAKNITLVVDKLGSQDVFYRQSERSLRFASHPVMLMERDARFDPTVVGFYLAHEGFTPAPFTLSREVRSVGRANSLQARRSLTSVISSQLGYWHPSRYAKAGHPIKPVEELDTLLRSSIDVRSGKYNAMLLSGGIDSTVLINLAAARPERPLAVTGAVLGWGQGESEIHVSRQIAQQLGIAHETIVLNPNDESLPEEYERCAESWMTGARLALPLWHRYAKRIRSLLGDECRILAGQTADTLADNNYTCETSGYFFRRILFASWMFRLLPIISTITPRPDSAVGRLLVRTISGLKDGRTGAMLQCLLQGCASPVDYYSGRIFGYGEFPGIAHQYFPMLTPSGFRSVVTWYKHAFVEPCVRRMTGASFYENMIQLSMDMNMLHLDSRLLFHTYRLSGLSAGLPFMDARVVNYFGSLPYSARAFYHRPKHVVRQQIRAQHMVTAGCPAMPPGKTQEQLLLQGPLGEYIRKLLGDLSFLRRLPRNHGIIEMNYVEGQIQNFIRGGAEPYDAKLISKLATLEVWSRSLTDSSENIPPATNLEESAAAALPI